MTRLTTAIPAFALGVAAVALTAGCSAGQVSQTAGQVAAVPGANRTIELKDSHDLIVGRVALRDVMVQYSDKGYAAKGTAPLQVRIFNDSPYAVKLCSVDSDAGKVVKGTGGIVPPASPSAAASASASPSATPSASASASAVPSSSAAPSASAVPSPSAAAPVPAGGCALNITVPGQGYTSLLPGQATYLQLTDLKDELKPGVVARGFTFTFQDAEGKTFASDKFEIPMGTPLTPGPRESSEIEGAHTVDGSGGGEHK
ncbi:hypothetical protein [Longispora urticae]